MAELVTGQVEPKVFQIETKRQCQIAGSRQRQAKLERVAMRQAAWLEVELKGSHGFKN